MLHFSQREDYAILFITTLAKHFGEKPLSLSMIANETKMKLPFLRQVAIDLRKAELINAVEGKNGGYQLARQPKTISFADVIEAVEHKKLLSCCDPHDFSSCAHDCKKELLWRKLNKHFVKNLYHITFDRVLEEFKVQNSKFKITI